MYVEVKQSLSRSIMSSVGSGSSTVEFLIAFSQTQPTFLLDVLVNPSSES